MIRFLILEEKDFPLLSPSLSKKEKVVGWKLKKIKQVLCLNEEAYPKILRFLEMLRLALVANETKVSENIVFESMRDVDVILNGNLYLDDLIDFWGNNDGGFDIPSDKFLFFALNNVFGFFLV